MTMKSKKRMTPRRRRIQILKHQLKPARAGSFDFTPTARVKLQSELDALEAGATLAEIFKQQAKVANSDESIDAAVRRHQAANPNEQSWEIDGDGYFINP